MDGPEPQNSVLRPDDEPPRPDRPFHRKRRHKKSRNGCFNCKTRKVKCDEAFPTCRSCSLRKTDCVYPSSSSSVSSQTLPYPSFTSFASAGHCLWPATDSAAAEIDATTVNFPQPAFDHPLSLSSSFSSIHASSSTMPLSLVADALAALDFPMPSFSSETPCPPHSTNTALAWTAPLYTSPGLLPPSPNFDNTDLKLLWHYTVKTCTCFSVDPGYQRPAEDTLRTTLVSYAFEAPFLMDNLFALSCLDLQNFEPGFDRSRALTYRARAIEGYRRAVEAARPESFPALIANSLILTALSSQTFRDPHSKDLYIIDWMLVWRGIGVIIDLVGLDTLFKSGLGIIFFRPTVDLDASALAIPNHLFFMTSSIPASDPDLPHIAAYITTLKFLGSLYLRLHVGFGPDLSLRIVTWLTYIPRAFVDLCQLRRPRALVILAHFAAFVKLVKEIWWFEGISERSIADISAHLGPDWQSLLRVPLAVSQVTDKLSIARAILEDTAWTNPERPSTDVDVDFAALREEDPRYAAFHHIQREHQQDADTDRHVDADFNRRIAQALS